MFTIPIFRILYFYIYSKLRSAISV